MRTGKANRSPSPSPDPSTDAEEARLRQLEAVIEQSGECIVVHNLDGIVLLWNRQAARLYGFSAAEALGRPLRELHASELSDAEYAGLLQRMRSGTPSEATVRRRRKNGKPLVVFERTVPWLDAQGRPRGEISYASEVTRERSSEAALADVQAQFAGVIDSAMDAIVTVDEAMRVQQFNAAAEHMFGYRAAQVRGQSIDRLIPSELREVHREHLRRFARSGESRRSGGALNALRALRSDGSEFLAEATISKTRVGSKTFFTAILRDATERTRLVEEIVRAKQQMELALHSGSLGLWDLDLVDRRLYHDRRLLALTGHSQGEVVVDESFFRARLHPDDVEGYDRALLAHLKGQTPALDVEYRLRHRNGDWVWILSRGRVVLRDETGRALRMVGTSQDVTVRKTAEENERRALRAFRLQSRSNFALAHAGSEAELLAQMCDLCVDGAGYALAWVGLVPDGGPGPVGEVARAGRWDASLRGAGAGAGEAGEGGPAGIAVRQATSVVVQDLQSPPAGCAAWCRAAGALGLRSCAALPLLAGQEAIGALLLCSERPAAFHLEEAGLLEQLARDLSHGLQTLAARSEHERARKALERESEKNQALLRNASDGIHILDPAGRLLEASDSFCRMLGYGREELIGAHASLWDARFSAEELDRMVGEQFRHGGHGQFETRHRRKDGTEFAAEISGNRIELHGGPVLFNSSRDITRRKQAEESLRLSETRLRAVIDQSPMAIAFSREGRTMEVNAAYLRMFGFDSVEALRGRPITEQIAPQWRAEIEDRVRRRLAGFAVETNYETVGLRRDGSQFPMFVSSTRLEFQGEPSIIAFLLDVSEQKASEEEIRRLAFYDHLTELPNRRLLQDRLRQAVAATRRSQGHGALLYIDLDDFKSLNDTLGHSTGDALLQQIARRLSASVREGDTIARMGGDEFVVVLGGLSADPVEAAKQTEAVCSKILAALNPPFQLAGQEYHCSASIGATLFGEGPATDAELVKQADIAMYQAKKAGRNSVRFFDPRMQEIIVEQAALEVELHQALRDRRFALHYQIQVDRSGRRIGAEVLLRWQHPVRGLVPPAQFIPLAERTDLIVPIGRWVLDGACAQLARWAQDPRTRDLVMCVNVSARQFFGGRFVDDVRECVQRHQVNPERLTLELTESLLIEDIEDTVATMRRLREVGVRFSLDDFGTGYSSLQYLKRLPLHQLKIDASFVRDIVTDASDMAIVQTIIGMARSLNLRVIAEGVETQEQRVLLLNLGCEEFQGYFFGRPVPIEEFERGL